MSYLSDVVPARAGVVTEPAEEALVPAPSGPPELRRARQVLATVPQDGVGHGHW